MMKTRCGIGELLSADVSVLMEGAVVERVRRGLSSLFDPLLMNAPLVYGDAGRALLRQIYAEHIDIWRVHALPFLSLAPTWRANPDRLAADALASTGCPYLVGFIVRPSGRLLDGKPLDDAMSCIDDQVVPRPLGYLVNCVHSSVLESALRVPTGRRALASGRFLGLQANTSSRSPEELEGFQELAGEAPEAFASGMYALRKRFGLRVLGGCCGTDGGHIAALARGLMGA